MSTRRVDPLRVEDCKELEAEFERARQVLGFIPNSLLTMGRRPGLVRAFGQLSTQVFLCSDLNDELKDMIALVASAAAGCSYCQAHTASKLAKHQVPSEKIEKVWEFENSLLFSDAERAALKLARDAAQVPNSVTDAHFVSLHNNFSDAQIVDIVGIISLFGFLNRWNDTFATTLEDKPSGIANEVLSDTVWQVGKHAR